MTGWRQKWIRDRLILVRNLNRMRCKGSYAESAIILSSIISALAAETWPGERIDRKRFVEAIVQFSSKRYQVNLISIPLLINFFDEGKQKTVVKKLKRKYLNFDDSRVLTGGEIDLEETILLKDCKISSHKIRKYSYPNILYEEVRSGYVHEYKAGSKADSFPMSSAKDQGVSYVNLINEPHRKIHFHIEWWIKVARSIARTLDKKESMLPLKRPTKWWLEG